MLAGATPNFFSLLQGEAGRHGVEYRFHTEGASGAHWRIRRAEIREALSSNYEVQLELTSNADDDATVLLGKGCTVTLLRDGEARAVHGIVSRVSRGDHLRDVEVIEVSVVPALEALAHRTDTRIFQDKTIPEVLQEVLSAGLTPHHRSHEQRLHRTVYPKREYIVQHRESDLAFARRLMADEGIWYGFEHPAGDGEAELLVLCDTNDAATDAQLGSEGKRLNLAVGRNGSADREVATKFVRADLAGPTSLTVREYNWTAPDVPELKLVPGDTPGDRPQYEPHDLTLWAYTDPRFGKFDTLDQARLRWEQREASQVRARGTSNVTGLCPGTVVQVQGHPGGLDGEWLIVSVDARGTYLEDSGRADDDYANTFTCIPKKVPFRPRREAKPRVYGIQTGTVVGPDGKPEIPENGDDVHTDSHGRIQVKLSWDRTPPTEATATESCFLRVAQGWAGQGWGFVFIPRIGMEVIVSFIDGDPDRPLVTGCVYNGMNRPHYELPADKTKSYIMTQSTPSGGGSNELRFEDAKGSEEIFVHAQKDYNEVVENDHTMSVGANDAHSVAGDRTHTIKKNETIVIDGSQKITITGKESGSGQSVKGGQLDITGQYKLDASDKIDVQAPNKITLTVGGSSLTMEPGKITLTAGGNATLVLDANVFAQANGKASMLLDANANLHANGGGDLLLDANAHLQSKAGSSALLDANVLVSASTGASTTLTADALVFGANATLSGSSTATATAPTATLAGEAGSVEASSAGVTCAGPEVTLSGDGKVTITGGTVAIN